MEVEHEEKSFEVMCSDINFVIWLLCVVLGLSPFLTNENHTGLT